MNNTINKAISLLNKASREADRDYMEKLKSLLTEGQLSVFNKIYPEGMKDSQIEHAIRQLETTLRGLNDKNTEYNALFKSSAEANASHIKEVKLLHGEITALRNDLNQAERKMEQLKNPINTENMEVQQDLDLLEALRAAGVDNWSGWDYAIERLNEQTTST